jgi:hypothetical protein
LGRRGGFDEYGGIDGGGEGRTGGSRKEREGRVVIELGRGCLGGGRGIRSCSDCSD